ncbi:MAG TPA: FmdB family zinc ribbon protein [Acidimicrobiales bacterium]|nr:FmdB family zinc ribbon protein [Acidimicrobiales bacterium]
MPTYEYACRQCRHRLDVVQKFSDDPLTTCPECGGELRKVYGAVGIVLKGSGFYKTDSRASSPTSSSPGKDSGPSSDSSGSSTSPEPSSSGSSDSPPGGSSKDAKAKDAAPSRDAKAKTPVSTSS